MHDGRSTCLDVLALILFAALTCVACSRGGEEPAHPQPTTITSTAPAATVNAAATPVADAGASPEAVGTPMARHGTPSSEEMWEFVEGELSKDPSGPDFEVDAVASSYYGPVPNTVFFIVRALNGTPPFTYTWKFDDNWQAPAADRFYRTFDRAGQWRATATATDANGATDSVELGLRMVSPEEYVSTMHLDPKLLDNLKSPTATPASAPTP